jgi:uncharacterized protein YjiS (DUF1127 family)
MSTHSALMGSRIGVMTQFAEGVTGGVSAVTGYFAARAERARVYRELSNLTDRDLEDIGVTRGEIADIASQA